MNLSALLPALAFFGSVAVATSGPSSGSGTSKIVKKAAQGFVDKPTTPLGKFKQGAGDKSICMFPDQLTREFCLSLNQHETIL